MKSLSKILPIAIFIVLFAGNSTAQDIKGGTVKYEHMDKFVHGLQPRTGPNREAFNNFLANLPKTLKESKVLFFNTNYSLFELDLTAEGIVYEGRMQGMIQRIQMGQPPETKITKVFIDLKKNKKTTQVELMTRLFLLEAKVEKFDWKPGTEQRKIQGYVCQEATTKIGEETITAWFAQEIPVSVGPDVYGGLPGLILAVDINGDNILLATSVDLIVPDDNISEPKDGKKIKQKAYDIILAEKIAEHEKIREQREKAARANQRGGDRVIRQ